MKKYILYTLLLLLTSCTWGVKKNLEEKFERQVSNISLDKIFIGDTLNYWGGDAPKGTIFFPTVKMSKLKSFGIKTLDFSEFDKPLEVLNKQIATEPLYRLELYKIEKNPKITPKEPTICDLVSDSFSTAELIMRVDDISFRVKERNWIPIEQPLNDKFTYFLRLSLADPFETLPNKAPDGFSVNARIPEKSWAEFSYTDKKDVISWGCQESIFIESKRFEPTFYNADIVFQYE